MRRHRHVAAALELDPGVHERPTSPPPADEPRVSETRLRAAPPTLYSPPSEKLLSWVEEQKTPPRDDFAVELEQRLCHALVTGNGPAALINASALAYTEPEHGVARRIKERSIPPVAAAKSTREVPKPDAVPVRILNWSELRGRSLSRDALYLLSCIDGAPTVEWAIDASSLSVRAAYVALDQLLEAGVVYLM